MRPRTSHELLSSIYQLLEGGHVFGIRSRLEARVRKTQEAYGCLVNDLANYRRRYTQFNLTTLETALPAIWLLVTLDAIGLALFAGIAGSRWAKRSR